MIAAASDPRNIPDNKVRILGGLRTERDGPILRVTLAKPERRNAFDAELIRELHEAFSDLGEARP